MQSCRHADWAAAMCQIALKLLTSLQALCVHFNKVFIICSNSSAALGVDHLDCCILMHAQHSSSTFHDSLTDSFSLIDDLYPHPQLLSLAKTLASAVNRQLNLGRT